MFRPLKDRHHQGSKHVALNDEYLQNTKCVYIYIYIQSINTTISDRRNVRYNYMFWPCMWAS